MAKESKTKGFETNKERSGFDSSREDNSDDGFDNNLTDLENEETDPEDLIDLEDYE